MKLTLSCGFGFEEDWEKFGAIFSPSKFLGWISNLVGSKMQDHEFEWIKR